MDRTARFGLLLLCGAPLAAADRVERFAPFEVALQATGRYANPYVELQAEARLTGPLGDTRTIPLFWDGGDGGDVWRLRFAPDVAGRWMWSVISPDGGLHGKSGEVDVFEGDRRGSLQSMTGHPHHFQRQDGSPLWFLGDTAWGLFTDNAEERHDRAAALCYLDARTEQGFNVVHSMLLSEAGWGNSGGPPWNDIARQELNPAYWQEVERRIAAANERGIIVGLALAWGMKRGREPYAWARFPDPEARLRYARHIAARLSAYDVYFIVSGEWQGEVNNRKLPEETIRAEFISIGDALHAADPHGRMVAIHPMTKRGSVREYNAAAWMAFGDYQQNYVDLHERILESRQFDKPVVNAEYGYHLRDSSGNDGIPDKDNSTSLDAIRHATWDIVMAGGYVVTGFGTTYFGGNRDPGPFDLDAAKNDDWERQIGYLRKVFADLEYWELTPQDDLVQSATPRGEETREHDHVAPPESTYWCLGNPGHTYVVYARGVEHLDVQLDRAGYSVTWHNPRTGESRSADPTSSNHVSLDLPDREDWVVVYGK